VLGASSYIGATAFHLAPTATQHLPAGHLVARLCENVDR
jgi:hypothetical protein